MGRAPCCDKASVKRGPWSPQEDAQLKAFIHNFGTGGNWIALPTKAGLRRCEKSCRLRWLNYLRPNIKHGEFSEHEDTTICTLFVTIGNMWSVIAGQLPEKTDNDIKNYWKLLAMVDVKPPQHAQPTNFSSFLHQPSPYNYTSALHLQITPQDQEIFPVPMQNYEKTLLIFDGGDQAISSSSSEMDAYFNGTHKLPHCGAINGFGSTAVGYDDIGVEEMKQLMSSGNIDNTMFATIFSRMEPHDEDLSKVQTCNL